jgi:hypothetical protein
MLQGNGLGRVENRQARVYVGFNAMSVVGDFDGMAEFSGLPDF